MRSAAPTYRTCRHATAALESLGKAFLTEKCKRKLFQEAKQLRSHREERHDHTDDVRRACRSADRLVGICDVGFCRHYDDVGARQRHQRCSASRRSLEFVSQRQDRADHHPRQPDGHQARNRRPGGRGSRPRLLRPHLHARFHESRVPDGPHRRPEGRPEFRLGRQGLRRHRHLRRQDLWRRIHAGRLDPHLEQGSVQEGRARSREAAAQRSRNSCGREEDSRARGRHVRILFLRLLPRVQHLHHLADDGRLGLKDSPR